MHLLIAGFLFKKKRVEPTIPVEITQKLEPHNPDGYACPKCRGRNLIVADDKSGFCIDCNVGFTNLVEAQRRKPVTRTGRARKKP